MIRDPLWTARIAPWLQVGTAPGSFRIKAPPRVDRVVLRGPWTPQQSLAQVLNEVWSCYRINQRRI